MDVHARSTHVFAIDAVSGEIAWVLVRVWRGRSLGSRGPCGTRSKLPLVAALPSLLVSAPGWLVVAERAGGNSERLIPVRGNGIPHEPGKRADSVDA
jgi:hypothetical protein